MATFVMEIGSEELPSRFLAGEEAYLKQGFEAKLAESGLEFQSVSVYSTPRRAVVAVKGLAPVQAEKEEEISGPPARVAWKDGQPTKALEGFARTNGVEVKDTYLVTTPKGEYVAVKKRTGGRQAGEVLAEICPALVAGVPFAKRMHWGSGTFAFARPIRWILALLDEQVVSFEIGGVSSGRQTYGHREHGPGPFSLATPADYAAVMEKAGVMPSAADRRAAIIAEGNKLAASAGGSIIWEESLLDEVQGLCEHPVPLLGDIVHHLNAESRLAERGNRTKNIQTGIKSSIKNPVEIVKARRIHVTLAPNVVNHRVGVEKIGSPHNFFRLLKIRIFRQSFNPQRKNIFIGSQSV